MSEKSEDAVDAKADQDSAIFNAGVAFWYGKGASQDYSKAFELFERASRNKSRAAPEAHYYLGLAFLLGRGAKRDEAEAIGHFKQAIDGGFAKFAHFRLAEAYQYGIGTAADYSKAREEYQAASSVGLKEAGDRLKEFDDWYKQYRRTRALALLALTAYAAIVLGATLFWRRIPLDFHLPALFAIGGLGLGTAFVLAARSGLNARRQVMRSFNVALWEGHNNVRIGGRRWMIVGGGFYHLAADGGERGKTYDGGTIRSVRVSREIGLMKSRREMIAFCGGTLIACAVAVAMQIFPVPAQLIAACAFAGGFYLVVVEYLYRHGYQFVRGAAVLDPPPENTSREDMKKQNALGDSRRLTEQETQVAALGVVRRSSVHDQTF